MAQLVKKRRPGWVLLVVSALVASLFAVPAAAIDDDSEPNKPAATSACVGDATGDMMFSDVSEGHAFRGDINCLAYYGVTIGYGDGTFGPNNDVSNEEMILFMERAAGIAGADAEAVVGDFAMSGSDPVDRGDMALLIARLLASATTKTSPVNVTIDDDDGTFAVSDVADDDWDYFADSRRSLNRVSDSAVSALYETGVAKGTGMGYFSPASTVSRGAMAAFITRALAHTSARPEGVTVQEMAVGGAKVSVRDANFKPVANASLDLFSIATANLDRAFRENGWAKSNAATAAPKTGEDVTGSTSEQEGIRLNKFGSTVSVTVQLVDGLAAGEKAVPTAGERDLRGGVSRREGRVTNSDDDTNAVLTTCPADDTAETIDATGSFKLDATGEATFDVSLSDPDTNDTGDENPDTGVVTYVIALPDGITIATDNLATDNVSFSEAASVVTAVSVSTPIAYAMAPASGTAGNTVVVSVTDQYGAGVSGQSVLLSRTDANASRSDFPTKGRSTGVDGKVRIGYAHDTTSEEEVITATVTIDVDGTPTPVTGTATFYWVGDGAAAGTTLAVTAGDLEKNEIVVANGDDTFGLVRYDSNDQFTVLDADADTTGAQPGYGMATFEEWLVKDMGITPTLTTTTETAQTLSWGGYDATYSGDVANWTLSGQS